MWAFALEVITLQSPRGRLTFGLGATAIVFWVPYVWLAHLSLWNAVGWHSAPSIGLTRAYWLLIHGQPVAAWHRNALIYPVVAIAWSLLVYDGYLVTTGKK